MAKTQTLNFPQGASYLIPFLCQSRGTEVTDFTGWKVLFVVKKELTDPDSAALIDQLIIPDTATGYNELLLSGDETALYPVGRYYYQAIVVDNSGTVGKSEVGSFIVEETTLRAAAGIYTGPNPPLNPPSTAGLIFNARQPIILDIKQITTSGMLQSIYDPRHIQADVYDADNHTDGITKKVMTAAERTKLSGIATGATANQTDAYLLNRTNHTGTQAISTVTGLQTALDSKGSDATLQAHIANTSNPHNVTKTQVGLGSADNTADSAKNVLSATKLTTARTINGVSFDGTGNITITDATKEPTIGAGTTAQYWRGDKSWQTLDKTAVGLSNVDNTSDANKPVSAAQQTALDGKVDKVTSSKIAYGTDAAGNQSTFTVDNSGYNANTIAQRDGSGRIWTNSPSNNYHTASKIYVDTADALKVDKAGDTMTDTLNVQTDNANIRLYNQTYPGSFARLDATRYWMRWETYGEMAGNLFPGVARFEGTTQLATFRPLSNFGSDIGQSTQQFNVGYINEVRSNKVVINSGPWILSGTGSPNGSVSAPVGSTFIDTSVTSGVARWIKKTGTGNTGWVADDPDQKVTGVNTAKITVASSEPSSPAVGDLWVVV